MKTLLLMRHSYAASDNPALSDRERPLTSQGRTLAESTAQLLQDVAPDCIVYSQAVRTSETAALITAGCSHSPRMHPIDALYLAPAVAYRDTVARLARPSDNIVMVIGHNPGMATLVNSWTQEAVTMTPASVAIFQVDVHDWHRLTDEHTVPKLTGFISEGVRQP